MLKFLSREHLEKSIGMVQSRFPVPALISLILTIYICYQILADRSGSAHEVQIFTTITTLILTFFLSVGATLWTEGSREAKWKHLIQVFPITYGIIYYFSFSYNQSWWLQNMTFFLLHLAGFIACVFFTPFLSRVMRWREYSTEYSNYFSRVSWTMLMSMIVGVSLFILGAIAILTVNNLFDIGYRIEYNKLYGYWAAISIALVAPLYGLAQFPKLDTIESKTYENNRFFAFIVKYIAVPFVFIYFAILYAYSVKVLMNFSEWPKGRIAWLVIGFSTLGYLTYIYSKPYEKEAWYVATFRRYFPYAVIPQILMLAYAISLRIGQYGYTMNRYFVVAFGIWLAIVSLYFVFNKRKVLIAIPLVLSAIALFISVWPWSVFSYPQRDQQARLVANLQKANILQNGKIVPLTDKKSINKELSSEIYTQIEYLCRQDDCEYIKALFPEDVAIITEEARKNWEQWNKNTLYTWPNSYQIISGVTNKIGVEKYYPWIGKYQPKYTSQTLINYSDNALYPVDITGYDRLVYILPGSGKTISSMSPESYPFITFDSDTLEVLYHTASGAYQRFPITLPPSMQNVSDWELNIMNNHEKKDMTYTVSSTDVEIKIFFNTIYTKNPAYQSQWPENWQSGWASGIGLIKYKK